MSRFFDPCKTAYEAYRVSYLYSIIEEMHRAKRPYILYSKQGKFEVTRDLVRHVTTVRRIEGTGTIVEMQVTIAFEKIMRRLIATEKIEGVEVTV
jgi:hypothetical protein